MSIESPTLILILAPIIILILLFGWLTMLARNGKPLTLLLKGFGIEVSVKSGEHEPVLTDKGEQHV